jgi:hypothetical protein
MTARWSDPGRLPGPPTGCPRSTDRYPAGPRGSTLRAWPSSSLPSAPLRRGLAYWSAAPPKVSTRPAPSEIGAPSLLRPRDATAPPDVAAGGDDAGLTQRELLMELREDIKGLKATVDAIAKDQALGVERRAAMQRSAESIYERLDGHDRDLDRMLAWQNRADGALVLARWALGASLVSMKAWQDRRDQERHFDFDEPAFFAAVGGTAHGGYGLGALPDAPDEHDYPISALYAAEGLTASVVLPASYAAPGMPPVLDQRATPMCVAYSSFAAPGPARTRVSGG